MFYYTCNLSALTNYTSTEMICECWIFMCIYVLNWTVRWKLKSVTFCSADSDQVIDTGLFILRDKPDEDGNVLITFTRHRDAKGVSKTLSYYLIWCILCTYIFMIKCLLWKYLVLIWFLFISLFVVGRQALFNNIWSQMSKYFIFRNMEWNVLWTQETTASFPSQQDLVSKNERAILQALQNCYNSKMENIL